MSTDTAFLAIRLEGPLQAWGIDSQYSRRNTALIPTKSAIIGMCCAALGLPRGSDAESKWLGKLRHTRMLAIAIPRHVSRDDKAVPVRRIMDYHTVGGGYDPDEPSERGRITVSAEDRKPRAKNGQSLAVLTYRQYLCDASFGVVLSGQRDVLDKVAAALDDPVWGLWLGRKACIPAAPVHGGVFASENEALHVLIGEAPLAEFMHQHEVDTFEGGGDTLPDQPVSFDSARRAHAPRRVLTVEATMRLSE